LRFWTYDRLYSQWKFNNNNYTPSLAGLYIELQYKELIYSNDSTIDSISDENKIYTGRNFIRFQADRNINNYPVITVKVEKIFKLYKLDDIKLSEISSNSWYSVLWLPNRQNSPAFIVYYKFRGNDFTNTFKYLTVIGCQCNRSEDEVFWFSNHTNTPNFYEDFYLNKNMFNLYNVSYVNLGICK
jgi:hypothetical protein